MSTTDTSRLAPVAYSTWPAWRRLKVVLVWPRPTPWTWDEQEPPIYYPLLSAVNSCFYLLSERRLVLLPPPHRLPLARSVPISSHRESMVVCCFSVVAERHALLATIELGVVLLVVATEAILSMYALTSGRTSDGGI